MILENVGYPERDGVCNPVPNVSNPVASENRYSRHDLFVLPNYSAAIDIPRNGADGLNI